jgi:hypothetical protein
MMKHKPKRQIGKLILFVFAGFCIFWLITGCASLHPQTGTSESPSDSRIAQPEDQGWWFIRFRMDRIKDETRWEKDLLIAHQIMAPIIKARQQDIPLWRFHRRSANDGAGHQFSFIFFTSAANADLINREALENRLLDRMIAGGMVREVLVDSTDHNDRQAVGDTSDDNWSPVMKDSWPWYIMGVSRMWLEMIDLFSQKITITDHPSLDQLAEHYATINAEITTLWQQEGYHALLHHLNALYGYKPLIYWEKRLKSF